jgi:hypothetical protein
MKWLWKTTAIIPALAFNMHAEDENAQFRMMKIEAERMAAQAKIVSIRTAVMGNPVKNAPYSATEIREVNQELADGTRIHNETQAQVYRDSEGRTRRETPESITIWDPVAKVSYILNPKDQTAHQMPLGGGVFYFSQNGQPATFTVKVPAPDNIDSAKAKGDTEKGVHENSEPVKLKAAGATTVVAGTIAAGPMEVGMPDHLEFLNKEATGAPAPESLGTQNMEGVIARGTRTTWTIPTGEVGNDRPLRIVQERWYSPDLQMVVQSRYSDPRTGEQTFRLTNISRAEPPAYLFQVPPGYQIIGQK